MENEFEIDMRSVVSNLNFEAQSRKRKAAQEIAIAENIELIAMKIENVLDRAKRKRESLGNNDQPQKAVT